MGKIYSILDDLFNLICNDDIKLTLVSSVIKKKELHKKLM